jgi:multiple sugar transport system permease protein
MKENKISKAIIYFIGIAVALISLFPLIWMAVAGLKPEAEVLAVPFKFFPSRIDTQNYKVIIEEGLFLRSLGVTFLVAVISAVLALAINSMSAYVFARLELAKAMIYRVCAYLLKKIDWPALYHNYR